MPPVWTTAIPDWRERLVESRPLIPFAPLFPDEARAASEIFDSLPVIDVAGKPPFGDIGRPWCARHPAASSTTAGRMRSVSVAS